MAINDFDELMSIGIDIGKDTFHIVGFDPSWRRVLRKQFKRLALAATFEKLPRCIVGIALNSPGGNLVAGIVLGELIREQGANTSIGKTVQMRGEGISHLEELESGSCASACAFAFMGGVERSVANGSAIGVHQFCNPETPLMDAGDVQVLAGASLLHSISMGVDPRVIVAASGTAPEEIHWFRRSELIDFGLDTSAKWSDPWRLEPYGTV